MNDPSAAPMVAFEPINPPLQALMAASVLIRKPSGTLMAAREVHMAVLQAPKAAAELTRGGQQAMRSPSTRMSHGEQRVSRHP
jgi:hypothetical protein